MPAFETAEYRARVKRLSAQMDAQGIDTLVVLAEAHMDFLTGYAGRSDYVPQCAILRAGDTDASLMLRAMDVHCAYPTAYLDRALVHAYPENLIGTPARSPWEAIGARILEVAGDGRIGRKVRVGLGRQHEPAQVAPVEQGQGQGVVLVIKARRRAEALVLRERP